MTDPLSSLEARLQALEDERDIQRVINAYSIQLDHGTNVADFLDLFTDDAVWWNSADGRWLASFRTWRFEGHEQLAAFWLGQAVRETPSRHVKHTLGPTAISVDGDRAAAESYTTVFFEDEAGPLVWMIGRYIDRLRRCPDGHWRISERRVACEDFHVAARST